MKAEELLLIGQLFNSLGWPTEVDEHSQFPDLFERFCRMFSRLDQQQRALLLELTKSYTWIKPQATPSVFITAWKKMITQLPPSAQFIVVTPLLKPASTRPKSSDSIYYIAQGHHANLDSTIKPRQLKFCKSTSTFAKKCGNANNAALVLVDDYVGSGDTAIKALAQLRKDFPNTNPAITIVLALAAQTEAIAPLAAQGCLLVADQMLNRGISDNQILASAIPNAMQIMDSIGKRIGVKKADRFGYSHTEALATLTRTPNNTFPVYWTDRKVGGKVWDSPFTRVSELRFNRGR
ncbi:phosphoribosyltransferase-like protein [Sorangium sp. So ce385]|uniref:phosphoribosyltransferase-like protein n=1 Tax=Sorangium sp. So ce385 TaxID=3133308 RepID=UPI003F5BC389